MILAIRYVQEVATYPSYFFWVEGLHICRVEWRCTYEEAEDVDQRKGMQGCASSKTAPTDSDGLVGCVICMAVKSQLLKQHHHSPLRLPLHQG